MGAIGTIKTITVSDDRLRVGDTITISAIIENTGSFGAFHIAQFIGWEDDLGIHYFLNELEQTVFAGREGARWSFENSFFIHDFILRYQRRRHRIRAYTITSRFGIRHPLNHPGRPIILPDEEMQDIKSIDLLIGAKPDPEPEPAIPSIYIFIILVIIALVLLSS